MGGNPLDNTSRIATHYCIRGDIFGDNAAGTNYGIVADGDTGQNRSPTPNPYAVADADRFGPFHTGIASLRFKRMAGGVDAYIRPDEDIIADSDTRLIEYGQIEIGEEILTDVDIAAIVAAERLIHMKLLATVLHHFTKQSLQGSCVTGIHLIEFPEFSTRRLQATQKFRVHSIVNLSI